MNDFGAGCSEGFIVTSKATVRERAKSPFTVRTTRTDIVIDTSSHLQIRIDKDILQPRVPFKTLGQFTYVDYSNYGLGSLVRPHKTTIEGKVYFTVNRGPGQSVNHSQQSLELAKEHLAQELHDAIDYYLWTIFGGNFDTLVTCIDIKGVIDRLVDNPPFADDRSIGGPTERNEAFYKAQAEMFIKHDCVGLHQRTGLTLEDLIELRNNLMTFLKEYDKQR